VKRTDEAALPEVFDLFLRRVDEAFAELGDELVRRGRSSLRALILRRKEGLAKYQLCPREGHWRAPRQ
jgi:hypothetical protein